MQCWVHFLTAIGLSSTQDHLTWYKSSVARDHGFKSLFAFVVKWIFFTELLPLNLKLFYFNFQLLHLGGGNLHPPPAGLPFFLSPSDRLCFQCSSLIVFGTYDIWRAHINWVACGGISSGVLFLFDAYSPSPISSSFEFLLLVGRRSFLASPSLPRWSLVCCLLGLPVSA